MIIHISALKYQILIVIRIMRIVSKYVIPRNNLHISHIIWVGLQRNSKLRIKGRVNVFYPIKLIIFDSHLLGQAVVWNTGCITLLDLD